MKSISARLLLGTGIVLAVFVVLTALSVSYSVQQRAEEAVLDRLQGLVYGILGATEIVGGQTLKVNANELPDRRLTTPTSGMHAEIIGYDLQPLWQSTSVASFVPAVSFSAIGEWVFERVDDPAGAVHDLQLTSVWELPNGEELPFIVHVVTDASNLKSQLNRFHRTLWLSLLISAALLLLTQLWVLARSLQPLKQIGAEVDAVERGQRDNLSENVPRELLPLAQSINTLLAAERGRHRRYRYLLDDLAHSLKTPLSVLQNLAESDDVGNSHTAENKSIRPGTDTLAQQVGQMRRTLEHYLKRGTLKTPHYLYPALPVAPVASRVCTSIARLYHVPVSSFVNDIDPSFSVRIDEVDLYEILGNLLDNACKYGARQVCLSTGDPRHDSTSPVPTDTAPARTGPGRRLLIIDDDGPGFPPQRRAELTGRGVRADSRVEGQGMGLAACSELMSTYGGEMELAVSPSGGARISLRFAG